MPLKLKWQASSGIFLANNAVSKEFIIYYFLKLIHITLQLHKQIWDSRNTFVHEKTKQEARAKARQAVIQAVENYTKPTLTSIMFCRYYGNPIKKSYT
jgi:hypothetical protein